MSRQREQKIGQLSICVLWANNQRRNYSKDKWDKKIIIERMIK